MVRKHRVGARAVGVLLVATAGLSACSGGGQAATAELVVWTDEGKLAAVTQVASLFADEHGIDVTVQAIPDLRSSFLNANEAGNGPDVLVGAHDWIGQLVANNAIDPIYLNEEVTDGFAAAAIEAVTFDGTLYGVPYGMESMVLYCRTDLVGEDRFDTFEAMIEAGDAAVAAGVVEVPLSVGVDNSVGSYNLQALYSSAGGYIFGRSAEGTYDASDVGFDSEGGLAAAQKLYELGEGGSSVLRTSITGENATSLFATGRAACMMSGPWSLGEVRESLGETFAIQPIPGFAGMAPAEPFLGVQAFYVASSASNRTWAEEFVAGTTGVTTQAAMTAMFEGANLPPAQSAVRELAVQADPLIGIFAEAADLAAPMPSIPEMDQVFTPSAQAYVSIVGGADPEQTIRAAADSIRSAIAAN